MLLKQTKIQSLFTLLLDWTYNTTPPLQDLHITYWTGAAMWYRFITHNVCMVDIHVYRPRLLACNSMSISKSSGSIVTYRGVPFKEGKYIDNGSTPCPVWYGSCTDSWYFSTVPFSYTLVPVSSCRLGSTSWWLSRIGRWKEWWGSYWGQSRRLKREYGHKAWLMVVQLWKWLSDQMRAARAARNGVFTSLLPERLRTWRTRRTRLVWMVTLISVC